MTVYVQKWSSGDGSMRIVENRVRTPSECLQMTGTLSGRWFLISFMVGDDRNGSLGPGKLGVNKSKRVTAAVYNYVAHGRLLR